MRKKEREIEKEKERDENRMGERGKVGGDRE